MFKENVKSQVSKKESANPITNRYLPEAIAQSSCKIVRFQKSSKWNQIVPEVAHKSSSGSESISLSSSKQCSLDEHLLTDLQLWYTRALFNLVCAG